MVGPAGWEAEARSLRAEIASLRRELETGQRKAPHAKYAAIEAVAVAIEQMLDALEALEECDGGEEIDITGRGQDGPLTSKLRASVTQAACLWEPPHGIPSTFVAYADLIPPIGVNDA